MQLSLCTILYKHVEFPPCALHKRVLSECQVKECHSRDMSSDVCYRLSYALYCTVPRSCAFSCFLFAARAGDPYPDCSYALLTCPNVLFNVYTSIGRPLRNVSETVLKSNAQCHAVRAEDSWGMYIQYSTVLYSTVLFILM